MSKKPHTKTVRLDDKALAALQHLKELWDETEGEVVRRALMECLERRNSKKVKI